MVIVGLWLGNAVFVLVNKACRTGKVYCDLKILLLIKTQILHYVCRSANIYYNGEALQGIVGPEI